MNTLPVLFRLHIVVYITAHLTICSRRIFPWSQSFAAPPDWQWPSPRELACSSSRDTPIWLHPIREWLLAGESS